MQIEKGKLYYDTRENKVFKAQFTEETHCVYDKIAVHCPDKEDWDYVNKVTGWEWDFSKNHLIRLLDSENYRLYDIQDAKEKGYHIITIDQFKEFYPESVISNKTDDNVQNTQPHYDNAHGSLYKIAEQRGWNSYQFDIVKRIDRALKKGQFKEDLQKTKDLIDLWLREVEK